MEKVNFFLNILIFKADPTGPNLIILIKRELIS